jgi:hypothetical protein
MFTVKFWKDTAERTIRTFAQALLALIGTNAVAVTALDWPQMLAVSATAAVVAILTAIVATGVGDKGTPAFLPEG